MTKSSRTLIDPVERSNLSISTHFPLMGDGSLIVGPNQKKRRGVLRTQEFGWLDCKLKDVIGSRTNSPLEHVREEDRDHENQDDQMRDYQGLFELWNWEDALVEEEAGQVGRVNRMEIDEGEGRRMLKSYMENLTTETDTM